MLLAHSALAPAALLATVMLPSALPMIVTGLRIGLGASVDGGRNGRADLLPSPALAT